MKLTFAEKLSLPIDAATQTFGFIARKRAGKTYAAGRLVESLLSRGVQVIVMDMIGKWWGLRLNRSGKRSSHFDVIVIGGLHGDLPIEANSGALCADVAINNPRRAFVYDLSQLSLSARKRFAADFAERIWQRAKAEKRPRVRHIVVEEAQLLIPQKVFREDARMVGHWEEIVRLGGNYGIGVSMISQRPQSVNKEVLTQVECLVVLQTNGTPERKALKDWIVDKGANVDLVKELPQLPVGTAYIWSPQWLRVFAKYAICTKETFDSTATPKAGVRNRAPGKLKPIDLEALREQMAAVVKEAEGKDPSALKRRVAELEALVAASEKRDTGLTRWAAKTGPVAKPAPAKPAVTLSQLRSVANHTRKIDALMEKWKRIGDRMNQSYQVVVAELHNVRTALARADEALPQPALLDKTPVRRETVFSLPPGQKSKHVDVVLKSVDGTNLAAPGQHKVAVESVMVVSPAKGAKALLLAIAQDAAGATTEQLAVLTGYKETSRRTYLHQLKHAGLIEESGGVFTATVKGLAELGPSFQRLPTGAALREHWMHRLPEGERRIFNVVVAAYPKPADKVKIFESTGYKETSIRTYAHKLSARKLVQRTGDGWTATASLFA